MRLTISGLPLIKHSGNACPMPDAERESGLATDKKASEGITAVERHSENKESSPAHNEDGGSKFEGTAIFLVGSALVGGARFLASDFDRPISYWVNCIAIVLIGAITGVSLYKAFPKLKTIIAFRLFYFCSHPSGYDRVAS
jgi:hypothetical protein